METPLNTYTYKAFCLVAECFLYKYQLNLVKQVFVDIPVGIMSLLSAKDTNKQHKAEYRRLSMKVIYKQLNIQQSAPEGWALFYKV